MGGCCAATGCRSRRSREFEGNSIKPVRLLGENLTLYKDLSGTYGLVDRHCPHRRADLSYGFVEQCGIRCNYHGWLFDEKGPLRRATLGRHRHTGSELQGQDPHQGVSGGVKAGLIWAYLGP